jgi:hypothetical protein
MNKELKNHEMIQSKLLGVLEDDIDDWWRNYGKLFNAFKK